MDLEPLPSPYLLHLPLSPDTGAFAVRGLVEDRRLFQDKYSLRYAIALLCFLTSPYISYYHFFSPVLVQSDK